MKLRTGIALILILSDWAGANAADLELAPFIPSWPASNTASLVAQSNYEDGLHLVRDEKLPEAMEAFGRAASADAHHTAALHMLGLCSWLEGDTRNAVRYLVVASRQTNVLPQTYMALAAISAKRGDVPESAGWMKKAFILMPDEERRTWADHDYFLNVRASPLFKEMMTEFESTNAPGSKAVTEDTPARF